MSEFKSHFEQLNNKYMQYINNMRFQFGMVFRALMTIYETIISQWKSRSQSANSNSNSNSNSDNNNSNNDNDSNTDSKSNDNNNDNNSDNNSDNNGNNNNNNNDDSETIGMVNNIILDAIDSLDSTINGSDHDDYPIASEFSYDTVYETYVSIMQTLVQINNSNANNQ